MNRSLSAASALINFEEPNPASTRLLTLPELFATLLDGSRLGGATRIEISYDAQTGLVKMHDDGCMAAGPRTLALLRDTLAAGPVEYARVRSDLHRYLSALSCSRRLLVETPAYSVTLSATPTLKIEKVMPCYAGPVRKGVTLTFELVQPLQISSKALNQELQVLARGFPLTVTFNNEIISRPFSLSNGEYSRFTHGRFLIDDLNLPDSHHIFLNGLPIEKADGERTFLPDGIVVHLHPDIFRATLPARNELIGGAITLSFLRHELHLMTGFH